MDRDEGLRQLRPKLAATRRRLLLLGLGRAFGPVFILVGVFACLALAGGFEYLASPYSETARLLLLALCAWLGWRGARRLAAAEPADAAGVLDRQLPSRPISSLHDRPSDASLSALELWQAHRARMVTELARLRVPGFSGEWNALDPWRIRYLLPVAVLGLFILAGPRGADRLADAIMPDIGVLAGADRIVIEAWVTPPEYTGRPPVFLQPGATGIGVPEGSMLTLRSRSASAPELVVRADRSFRQRFDATADQAWESQVRIDSDTRLSVRFWGERAVWTFAVIPDLPPTVTFTDPPALQEKEQTGFSWQAGDDYGIVSMALSLSLQVPHPADPGAQDLIAVSVPGVEGARQAEGTTRLDLGGHKWAGLEVLAELVVTDAAGQEGRSGPVAFTLPEKLFLDPVARAAQEVRLTLLREPRGYSPLPPGRSALTEGALNAEATGRLDYAPEGVRQAALMLEGLTYRGDLFFDNLSAFFGLRMALGVLQAATGKQEADAAGTLLWSVALKLEHGSVADARARLEMARAALERALRDGAPEEEIRRLMELFRDAANEYLAARMAEAFAAGGTAPPDQAERQPGETGPSLAGQDFEDMLNALQDLTETGASDQARQLLSDITNLLENLAFERSQESAGPGQPGQGADGEPSDLPAEEQALTDAMRRLNEILQEQRQLNDETLARQRGELPQGQSGPDPGSPGAGPAPDGPGAGGSLQERQEQLGGEVGDLARGGGPADQEAGGGASGDSGLDEEALGAIADAQRRAGQALGAGQDGRAIVEQEQATRMLSDLSRELAGELDALRADRTGQAGQAATDPLGRPMSGSGNDGQGIEIPAESERRRARDILEELRRRYGEAASEEERDYLRRLLDRF